MKVVKYNKKVVILNNYNFCLRGIFDCNETQLHEYNINSSIEFRLLR
jgi:hypothetical protein